MRWIVRALRGNGRSPRLICYLRENGPIAYVLPILGSDPRSHLEALLDTGFTCYWAAVDGRGLPGEWTQMTRWSMAALLSDLAAEEGRRGITVLAFESADLPHDLPAADVISALRAFLAENEGHLRAVVQRRGGQAPGEQEVDRVFVAQQPPESVRALMQAWNIDPIKAERRAYARLRGTSLEDWLGVLTQRATSDRRPATGD